MIDLIVYDFDGVMTNNKVILYQDGKEAVVCNRNDGWAVKKIKEMNIPQLILSSEENIVVQQRANKLSIPCEHGFMDKTCLLKKYCLANGLYLKNVVYVGNGLNDLEIMKIIGYSIAPKDAHPAVLEIADLVTKAKGGEGVLLEVLEYLERIRI